MQAKNEPSLLIIILNEFYKTFNTIIVKVSIWNEQLLNTSPEIFWKEWTWSKDHLLFFPSGDGSQTKTVQTCLLDEIVTSQIKVEILGKFKFLSPLTL